MSETAEINIRQHRVVLERDVVRLYLNGIYTPEDFQAVIAGMGSVFKQYPQVYMLIDVSGLEAFPPETRKAWIEWVRDFSMRPAKVLIIGASFTLKTVIMMMKAMRRLLASGKGPEPMLFDSEAQALAYLKQIRGNQALSA